MPLRFIFMAGQQLGRANHTQYYMKQNIVFYLLLSSPTRYITDRNDVLKSTLPTEWWVQSREKPLAHKHLTDWNSISNQGCSSNPFKECCGGNQNIRN